MERKGAGAEYMDGMARYSGRLVQRRCKPGQQYVQLVFETAEGVRLCLSRNLHMVRALTVGREYNIRGQEFMLGDKSYIHEPIATLVQDEIPRSRPLAPSRRLVVAMVSVVVSLSLLGGFLGVKSQANHDRAEPRASSASPQQAITAGDDASGSVLGVTSSASPSQTTTAPVKNSPSSTTTTSPATAASTSATPAVSAPPAPDPAPVATPAPAPPDTTATPPATTPPPDGTDQTPPTDSTPPSPPDTPTNP